jgi:hypothetical protein
MSLQLGMPSTFAVQRTGGDRAALRAALSGCELCEVLAGAERRPITSLKLSSLAALGPVGRQPS